MDGLAPFREIPGNEHVLKKLKDLISSGKAIAFVGAGASAGKYPLWIPLLHELADLAVDRDNVTSDDRDEWLAEMSKDPLGVAARIKAALGHGIFYSRLDDIFRPRADESFTDTHKRLVSLPFKGFVTTNYDRGLVDAWQVTNSGTGSKSVATPLDNVATNRWLTADIYEQERQPIFHAHGIIDNTKSLILTLDDYTEAYQTGKSYRRLFDRLFIQDYLVFVGFGFTDPWMFHLSQTILREIHGAETGSAPRHIAVIGLPSDRKYTREQRKRLEQEYDAEIVFYPVEVSKKSGKRHEDHSALAVLLSTLDARPEQPPQAGQTCQRAVARSGFTPGFLDELHSRISLPGLVGRKVKLVRRGREYAGLCPFHHEKTPSFYVVEDKSFFHCFGCGAHGDVIGFAMRADNLDFIEAIERLAAEVGLAVPQLTPQVRERAQRQKALLEATEAAAAFYEASLWGPAGSRARDYLPGRGLDQATIRRFRLGWAPDDRQALRRGLASDFPDALMIEAGLRRQGENGAISDFFRNRVTFPIGDRAGRVPTIAEFSVATVRTPNPTAQS
jgi:CHC2 zinc finger/SIR2-like domain/DNA primase catalytic core, N-terminal domain